MSRPWIALTTGDPAGIGPEIVEACLGLGLEARMRLLVIGPGELCPASVPKLPAPTRGLLDADSPRAELEAVATALRESASDRLWLPTGEMGEAAAWELGRPQAAGGRAAHAALRTGAELAQHALVEALVTAPVSKEALRAAGHIAEGQTQLLGEWAGAPEVDMLAIAGRLRVSLLTRHLPLADAIRWIIEDRGDEVVRHLHRLSRGLEQLGIERPRLALAGLNPHAGEGGMLGNEERDFLTPALNRARDDGGLDVTGPLSPDTVFLQASQGAFDAVLALYHDQGFIPIKLAAPMGAVTVLLGLPYLRVSPAHGTAFDIAGRGIANPSNLRVALEQAAEWCGLRAGIGGY